MEQLLAHDEGVIPTRFNQLRKGVKMRKSKYKSQSNDPSQSTFDLRPSTLSADESELLEILVLHPELAATALTDVADDDITSSPAREILQTYRYLEEGGHSLDFHSVLSEIEDPQLKHLLVKIDDLAHEKSPKAILDPPDRLRTVIRQFHQKHELRQIRQTESALEQRTFTEEEEQHVLKDMIAAKRRQQGIHAPTDG